MKVAPRFTAKTLLSSTLAAALLTTTIGCTAMASDHDNKNYNNQNYGNHNNQSSVYRDGNFGTIAQKLRRDLSRSGYQVMDIQADTYRGNQSLVVYAKKNNQPYEMKYTYPGLKLISSSQKDWSNVWKDKNRQHGNNYQNNRHNNNVEDNIKKEARYPAVKQRAINKVRNMGYTIKDIELKEKNNRGMFEIEAKRGNEKYDIVLGYPDLNVIKLEKD
ncbi:hypothetical protein [Psychrobacter sp. 16-MNA-CIBAN-0192]|uniref:hypothetical protein n=1 Tax=Psychrobacter sp. 16-MNA-CIBAN-0192 TaxID=3140448 RepID=UPI003320E65D